MQLKMFFYSIQKAPEGTLVPLLEIRNVTHRIAVMREGCVEQVDEPAKLYAFPSSRFVADFIGHINLLDAQVLEATHGPYVWLLQDWGK